MSRRMGAGFQLPHRALEPVRRPGSRPPGSPRQTHSRGHGTRSPGGERLGGTIWQHVDDTAVLDVDQDSAVDMTALESEVVDDQQAGTSLRRLGRQPTHPVEQGVGADAAVHHGCQPGAGRPARKRPIAVSMSCCNWLRRPCRKLSTSTCSTKVLRGQDGSSHRNRRTVRWIVVDPEALIRRPPPSARMSSIATPARCGMAAVRREDEGAWGSQRH